MSVSSQSGYRLSPEQTRIWSHIAQGRVLNTYSLAKVTASVDVERLRNAVKVLSESFDIVRTIFPTTKERKYPLQTVQDAVEIPVIQVQLSTDQSLNQYVDSKSATVFDHDAGPLVQVELIQKSAQSYVLIVASSMLFDAGSLASMWTVVDQILSGKYEQQEVLQYPQIAVWQHDLIVEAEEEVQAFWNNFPHKITQNRSWSLISGTDMANSSDFACKSVQLDSKLVSKLQKKAQEFDCDIHGLLPVLLADMMSRYSGSEHLNVTITDPVRGFDELKDVIGNLAASIPWKYDKSSQSHGLKGNIDQIQQIRDYSLYFNSEKMTVDGPKTAVSDAEIQLPVLISNLEHFQIEQLVSMRGCNGLQCSIFSDGNQVTVQWFSQNAAVSTFWLEELSNQISPYLSWSVSHAGTDVWKNSWLSAENQKVTAQLSGVTTSSSEVPLLVELLDSTFRSQAPAMALIHGMKWLNFKQVQQQSQRIARNLVSKGITTGSKVGILLPRSVDAILGILGVVQAGACYVPIDTEYPDSRISFMIEDAELSAVITTPEFKTSFGSKINCLEVSEILTTENNETELPIINGDDPVYSIYTSGSTGTPKGCVITHNQLAWYLDWTKNTYFEDISGSSVPLFTSLAFDLTITTIFGSLISGNCLTIFDESVPLPQVLETIFDPNGTTEILKMTPAHALVLATTPLKNTGVRRIVVGGEALLPVHVDTLLNLNPKLVIYNEYGPTETVVGCSVDLITSKEQSITIGNPVSHASMYVVDSTLNLLPIGVPGELVIGGRSVGQGYYNRPELTESRFVTLPFNNERVYRSGDLAYLQHDHKFAFLGRTDSQVKIRGYRIEPDEIRTRLQQLPGIIDAFVTTSTYTDDSLHLVGYVVSKSVLDEDQLKNKLGDVLPAYMVPSFILQVESIPLTVNGKVDTKALPDLSTYLQQKKRVVRHPENALQHDLANIWKEVLGVDELSIDDNFFDLGGHSLKAMQIVSRIQHQLKQNLLLSDFFDHVTVEQLEKHLSGGQTPSMTTIPKSKEASSYPSSGPQRRLWVLDKLPGAKRAYHVSEVYHLKGDLDVAAFNNAIRAMISRHEVLRTSFISENDVPMQVIHADVDPMVEFMDATVVDDSETWIEQVTQSVLQTPFDLGSPTLFRSVLIKTGSNDYRWVSCMHHIISDGWSVDLMVDEIQELYLAEIQNRNARVPELMIQYKDVSSWMESRSTDPEYLERESFWLKQYQESSEPITFPFQKTRPALKTYSGGAVKRKLSEPVVKQVQSLQRSGHSTFFGLTTALSLAIKQVLGRDEFVIGTPVAGRFLPEMEPLIGFFVNVVPLKMTFESKSTVNDALKQVRTTVLKALEHQDVSFDSWTSKLNHQADPSRSPIFDVMIVYHNNPASNWASTGFTLEPVPIEEKHSKYDLVFEFTDRTDTIEFRVDYNTDLFDAKTIHAFCDYIEHVAGIAFADLNAQIQELPSAPPSLTTPLPHTPTSAPHPAPDSPELTHDTSRIAALTAAWKKALGREDINPADNFFSLGGDSIKAIQLASALFQQGYRLPIATLFSFPTINELESRLIEVSDIVSNDQVSGNFNPTPIQRWLLNQNPATKNGFYQTALLQLVRPIPLHVIHTAWQHIMTHHDALRTTVIHGSDSASMHILAEDTRFAFDHIEIDEPSNDSAATVAANWINSWIDSTTIETDPLCRLLVLSYRDQRSLFVAIHHLVVDIVSWRVILEDLNSVISAIMQADSVELTAKSTSFLEWTIKSEQAINQEIGQKAAQFWSKSSDSVNSGLFEKQNSTKQTSSTIEIPDFSETVQAVAGSFEASVSDVLITAFSRVFQLLNKRSNLTFALEGHGRDLLADVPVDRTVGWFTSEFPVTVKFHDDAVRHLREVKESRVQAERYGSWFMSVSDTSLIDSVQRRGIGVNFLGDLSFDSDQSGWFELSNQTAPIDNVIESRLDLGKAISLVAHVNDNKLVVQVNSCLDGELSSKSIAETLESELKDLVKSLSQGTDSQVHTPSDFDYEGLDLDSLDDLLNSIK